MRHATQAGGSLFWPITNIVLLPRPLVLLRRRKELYSSGSKRFGIETAQEISRHPIISTDGYSRSN